MKTNFSNSVFDQLALFLIELNGGMLELRCLGYSEARPRWNANDTTRRV
ncbi:MAG TPA: hypothetical protein VHP99_14520 [Pyrinomonadaceae bacterium]|jgi:hypothetical protein|nr:hypothetical protein [Pyrinomonadaceae bacterium]